MNNKRNRFGRFNLITLADGSFYPKIPVVCNCSDINCNEICWNGNYIHGHHKKESKEETIKRVEKIAKANTGKKRSFKSKLKMSEAQCGNQKARGKHRKVSNETREKQRQSQLGKKRTPEAIEKTRRAQLGRINSLETKEKMRQSKLHIFSALDHLCKDKYCHKFNKTLREQVRLRDSYTCQNCGITQEEHKLKSNKILSVHHIHYDKSNCYPDLITLCISCNTIVNYNKNYYESFFMNKLNDRSLLFWTKRKR